MSEEIRARVVADAEGIIRMWSSGAEALFGYPAADAVGRSLEDREGATIGAVVTWDAT